MRPRFRLESTLLLLTLGMLARLGSVAWQFPYHLNPALDHWRFGWEMGRVAQALYEGRGFASPVLTPSGPTAWMAPVYPALVWLSFRLFGLHTIAAAWFILGLNSLFGVLTALPVRALARRLFNDERVALLAAWTWACLPYSIYIAGERIWENTLATLLAACLLWMTYWLERDGRLWHWLAWASVWAVAALTSPTLVLPLPAIGLWIALRYARAGKRWFWQATAAALLFFALITPWTVRNYRQFHRFIPMRGNFWLEVHVGNNGDDRKPCPPSAHPSNNQHERDQFAALGEMAYMDAKKVEAKQWIATHPGMFWWLTLRRTLFFWTGWWSATPYYLDEEPMEPFAVPYFTALLVLGIAGIRLARRNGLGHMLWPMLFYLIIYPLPYYFTHPSYDYRHPMDVVFVLCGSYFVSDWWRKRKDRRASI